MKTIYYIVYTIIATVLILAVLSTIIRDIRDLEGCIREDRKRKDPDAGQKSPKPVEGAHSLQERVEFLEDILTEEQYKAYEKYLHSNE